MQIPYFLSPLAYGVDITNNLTWVIAFFLFCMLCVLQAVHRVDVLNKEVNDLKTKLENNSKTQEYSEKQLTRMIVEMNDVS